MIGDVDSDFGMIGDINFDFDFGVFWPSTLTSAGWAIEFDFGMIGGVDFGNRQRRLWHDWQRQL